MQSECASQPESQHESERGADMDDDDGVASVMSGSVLHGARSVNSSNSLKKRKSRSGIDFRAWSFQMSIKIDFSPASSTAGEKRTILFEHLNLRTGHDRPHCVLGLTVFCDESHFSGHTDSEAPDTLGPKRKCPNFPSLGRKEKSQL